MPYYLPISKEALLQALSSFEDRLIFDERLLELTRVFVDRIEGGEKLAELAQLAGISREIDLVLAIPCGGVPVGFVFASKLRVPMDLLIVRKILIPWNTEAGYGAVDPEGSYVLNEELRAYLGFTNREVKEHIDKTLEEIKRRERIFREEASYDFIEGKSVLLVDDGIASGYTMLAAIKFARRKGAKRVIVGAPTASLSGIRLLFDYVDLMIIPNVRSGIPVFAVADAYVVWYDVTDEEVIEYVKEAKKRGILVISDAKTPED